MDAVEPPAPSPGSARPPRSPVSLRRLGSPDVPVELPGGQRVGVAGLLAALDRRGRRSWPMPAPGLAVHRAWAFGLSDQRDPHWWPQGVTTTADADVSGRVLGRRLVVTSAYEKRLPHDPESMRPGSRITVFDRETRRYLHVGLLTADGEALRTHAGGLAWCGPWLHIASTGRGFLTCHWDDLTLLNGSGDSGGPRLVLPLRFEHRATGTTKWRCSFVSVARPQGPDGPTELLTGEFATGEQSRRLMRWAVDPETRLPAVDADGAADPIELREAISNLQGAVITDGRWYLTRSHGAGKPGSIVVGPVAGPVAGPGAPRGDTPEPGPLVPRRFVVPMGVEDLAYDPEDDLLWTVTEHPWRRWLVCVRRSRVT